MSPSTFNGPNGSMPGVLAPVKQQSRKVQCASHTFAQNDKNRTQELESIVQSCECRSRELSVQLQKAARLVDDENTKLRKLLANHDHQNIRAVRMKENNNEIATELRSSHQNFSTPKWILKTPSYHKQRSLPMPISPNPPSQGTATKAPSDVASPVERQVCGSCGQKNSSDMPGTLTNCKTAIQIVQSVGPAQAEDEVRQAIGCTIECCSDQGNCFVENQLLLTILDTAI